MIKRSYIKPATICVVVASQRVLCASTMTFSKTESIDDEEDIW